MNERLDSYLDKQDREYEEYYRTSRCNCSLNENKKETKMQPKFPKVKVQLVGEDGNAFAILGKVKSAMRKANVPQAEIDKFMDEAMTGDYDHLLQTAMKWVNVS
jgi:hypothetical protein